MKRKDIQSLNQKTIAELSRSADEIRREIKKLELEKNIKSVKNNRAKRFLKDDLARILTALRNKKIDLK